METRFNLYRKIRELLDQIPDGMVSTPRILAEALGDHCAVRAVSTVLERAEFQGISHKISWRPSSDRPVFSDFTSDSPLSRLSELQRKLAKQVVREDNLDSYEIVAGVDVAYVGDVAHAACVVLDGLKTIDIATATVEIHFPYIPGYLSFREAPAINDAVKQVSEYDVLMVNGHGVAHPRGCGLATHVGLDLGVATVGVAGRSMVGTVEDSSVEQAPLFYGGRVVGMRLWATGRAPIFVSVGHNISLETGVELVIRYTKSSHLPEPLRRAHKAAEALKRQADSGQASA